MIEKLAIFERKRQLQNLFVFIKKHVFQATNKLQTTMFISLNTWYSRCKHEIVGNGLDSVMFLSRYDDYYPML